MKFVSSQIVLLSLTVCTAVYALPPRGNRPNEDINHAFRELGLMTTTEKDLGHPGLTQNTKRYADIAQACSVEAKRRLDGGEAADTLVKLTSNAGASSNVKLGDVEATVCRPLADKAKVWADAQKAAHDTADAAVAAPYKAVGIGGDKLDFLVSQKGNSDFYGVGGNLLKTPDDIKKASVLFLLSGGGTGEKWTLYRRQFSGDKAAGNTQQDFLVRPGPQSFQ